MDTDQLQQLITQLQNGNDQQRRAASYKLSKSKDPSVGPALMNAYNDKDSSVRQNVFDGLRSIGSKEAMDFLTSHEEYMNNALPSMDSVMIERDNKGVVTIKRNPLLEYVVGVISGLFGLGFLARGAIVPGIVGIAVWVLDFLWAGNSRSSFEFNPNTRIFKIRSGIKTINISFDDIVSFGVATEKERGNFTEKKILVEFKDGQTMELGVITDANEKNREEKVTKMMAFLNKTTRIDTTIKPTKPD